jgi:hypothetical protein
MALVDGVGLNSITEGQVFKDEQFYFLKTCVCLFVVLDQTQGLAQAGKDKELFL